MGRPTATLAHLRRKDTLVFPISRISSGTIRCGPALEGWHPVKEHQSSPPEAGPAAVADPVWRAFVDPPDDARPRAWWHWMDGNVDPAGIVRDLRWLHDVGVRGVQVFDGGMGGPLVVPAPVRPGSDGVGRGSGHGEAHGGGAGHGTRRRDLVGMERRRRTVGRTRRRDEEGGLVGVRRRRGRDRRGRACRPCRRCRASTRTARAGAPRRTPTAGRRTGACSRSPPTRPTRRWSPTPCRASAPIGDWSCLTDGSFGRTLALPRDPDGWSTAWIEQEFADPVTVRSVVVGLPGPRGFGAAPPASAVLQASDDGVAYRDVAELPADAVPARTASFPAVTARRFRLVLSGGERGGRAPAGGGRRAPPARAAHGRHLPRLGVRPPRGGARPSRRGQGRLRGRGRLLRRADRPASRRGVRGSGHRRRPHRPACTTACCAGTRPPGDWPVLRLGASLTGQTNGPALADATGLEVDKLDGERVRAYLDTHLRRFAIGDGDGSTPPLPASPHCSATASRPARRTGRTRSSSTSHALRGYDPAPWLPALAGYVVGGPRHPIASCTTTGARSPSSSPTSTTARSRRRRIGAAWRTTPRRSRTDDRSSATTSPCARTPTCRWARCGRSTPSAARSPTYVADLKGASSVAHVHGKAWVGRGGVHDLRPAVGVHAAHAQARRRPAARPRRHAVLHPHLAAPADRRSAARHRPRAVPRPGLHDQRDVVGHGAAVDRLPRAVLGGAAAGRAGGRRRGLRRRGGAGDRALRAPVRHRRPGRLRLRLRGAGCSGRRPTRRGRCRGRRRRDGIACCTSAGRASG